MVYHTISILLENLICNLWIRLKVNKEWLVSNKERNSRKIAILYLNKSCEKYVYHFPNFSKKAFTFIITILKSGSIQLCYIMLELRKNAANRKWTEETKIRKD